MKIANVLIASLCLFFLISFSYGDLITSVSDRTPEVRKKLEEITELSSEKITKDNLSKITILNLDFLGIKNLKLGDFDGLDNLEYLDLSANKLIRIPEKVFYGLNNLEELNLSHNQLINIPEKLFDPLSKLKSLSLVSEKLDIVPIFLIRRLTKKNKEIKFLHLGHDKYESYQTKPSCKTAF